MTSRLEIYNSALTICGERHLSSLNDNVESRRLLDHVFDNNGVDKCLERGQWKFAMRSVRLDYDPDVTMEYGYQRAFSKPTDWILTSAFCSDEYFNSPLTRYVHEAGYWYCDLDEVYIRYVSNDEFYGGDLSLWPGTFEDYVSAHFAAKIIFKLTSDEKKRESVIRWEKRQLTLAKSNDAMAGPQQFPAPGSFVTTRNRFSNRRDRGSRSQLLG